MIHTILQILVYQFLFLAVYDLFLKKETFFNLNRAYLLTTAVLSILLPFISLGFIQQNIPQEYYVELPAVVVGGTTSEIGTSTSFWLSSLKIVWILGMIISVIVFSFKILKIIKLKRSGAMTNVDGNLVKILPKTDSAFSFFSTIYLGENISEINIPSIISHEKIHIQQKHSIDLLFFELLRIVFWFNPAVYLFQNRISTLHEYIADAKVSSQKSKKEYYQNLLSEVFQTEQISFVNTFFKQSLIKKRIIMLQKSKSQKGAQVKYLLLLPVIFSMLFYTACSENPKVDADQQSEAELLNKIKEQEEAEIEEYRINQGNENIVVQIDTIIKGRDLVSDVPYSVIEKVPTYPGCSGDNETMRKCMSSKIAESINSNFNTSIANDLNISGKQRIVVQFKIDKTGIVTDVRARAKHPELEAEAIRVVNLLPQMNPGEQKGEKVGVLYSLPIVFDFVE